MRIRKRKSVGPAIPLASMSDIAMLLLIFFILTTQFITRLSMKAELPSVTPDKSLATEKIVTVVVKEEHVYLDEERIRIEDLAPLLAAKLKDRTTPEERAVILDGAAEVRYERVAWAANEIKRAGGTVTMMKVEE